jgi:hypothetical protein
MPKIVPVKKIHKYQLDIKTNDFGMPIAQRIKRRAGN